ncbi:PD-(D/E)XK nuclease family protein [Noviherbaspirillum suwonense]|uniref:DNA helicase/exodeoxyribonuclease V, subunit B n=1 Tax=Noviherbaspirillum suwonense TaxID=1224511 RepID=A0ABY1Q3N8_9BURK|nr:PD-(D/E)XK nuclease family protein [Noviherbaspirillum suwonense]SMP57229.1 DNA helicase/exodeoxyribonuclease V, subunit B [Noviherbaspirillum suwonense]
MPNRTLLLPSDPAFWPSMADALIAHAQEVLPERRSPLDLSGLRVLAPGFAHGRLLQRALVARLGPALIPPRTGTMAAWLDLLPPDSSRPQQGGSERLMTLYAQLRENAWLKKLFSARRNTDLLPLAETLLTLFDELNCTLLPAIRDSIEATDALWQAALAQLPPSAQALLSDEGQMVWSLWKNQLDHNEGCTDRFSRMLLLAGRLKEPLVWIAGSEPDACERAFLAACAERQPVLTVLPDWRRDAVAPVCAAAWPEVLSDAGEEAARVAPQPLPQVSVLAATSMEDEAVSGARTVLGWLAGGRSHVAIVAQDRVVARRIRALLERAQVMVTDETGWKLSTTRAAASLHAWFEVVATRARTPALLDLLKSPFVLADHADKPALVLEAELALRAANVAGGWDAVRLALRAVPSAHAAVSQMQQLAQRFTGRKSLNDWVKVTDAAMVELEMRDVLEADAAGVQVVRMLDQLDAESAAVTPAFSFSEWRALVGLQMEATPFIAPAVDDRVLMLPLAAARLRSFDAVLLVGADARHLPSAQNESLFFANAVRRELGLPTRESRQRQQLRDFAGLLQANPAVVLSWQAQQDGEPNPVSVWIERLQLSLARAGLGELRTHQVESTPRRLRASPPSPPAPSAPALLPQRLSASGYNSFIACPYQFFATRMLGLAGLDEFSDMPEKRDYGDWLHRVLHAYHGALLAGAVPQEQREGLLRQCTDQVFNEALARNSAVIAYYARWQKALPAYLAWANEREAQGWQFVMGERRFERTLEWGGGSVTLHGRIDRIDCNAGGERAVLDYKTRDAASLRSKLKDGEDHQLAFYGLLSDEPVASASYVALEPTRDKAGEAEAPRYAESQQALRAHILASMAAVADGAPLPANGAGSVCQYCEVRGLCRKGAW